MPSLDVPVWHYKSVLPLIVKVHQGVSGEGPALLKSQTWFRFNLVFIPKILLPLV